MRIDLALILGVAVLISIFSAHSVSGEEQTTKLEFGTRQIPNKIIENTEATIKVFVLKNDNIFPQEITDLSVSSLDPSTVKVIGVQQDPQKSFVTNIKIKAGEEGETKLAMAAAGFESKEIPIQVYRNTQGQKEFLVTAHPASFSVNGPHKGYLSVEVVDANGIPVIAKKDINISLEVSKKGVVNLQEKNLTIEKGEYYVVKPFEIEGFHEDVQIFASSTNDIDTGKATITAKEPQEPLQINHFVFPKKTSANFVSHSYIIAVLQDSAGNPIRAMEDIPISVRITDPVGSEIKLNERGRIPYISSGGPLAIKEGSYWGYTKLVTDTGMTGTYEVSISAKSFQVSSKKEIELVETTEKDKEGIVFDTLPVLQGGQNGDSNQELAGVIHLEDDGGNPLLASEDIKIDIVSSDEQSLSVEDTTIRKGESAALVFVQPGYTKSGSLTLYDQIENKEVSVPTLFGPPELSNGLVIEPLIPKILANTEFPLVSFVKQSDGSVWYFTKNERISFSPSNEFLFSEQRVSKGMSPFLFYAESKKAGSDTIVAQTKTMKTEFPVKGIFTKPSRLVLQGPDKIFSKLPTEYAIQLVDEKNIPATAEREIEIKIISNNEHVIQIDQHLEIGRGNHHTNFVITPSSSGTAEIALLVDGFPLTKKTIEVVDLKPELALDTPKEVDSVTSFAPSVTATYNDIPLKGLDVSWDAKNASIERSDTITSTKGSAKLMLISGDKPSITVKSTVSGGWFNPVTKSSKVNVNLPKITESSSNSSQQAANTSAKVGNSEKPSKGYLASEYKKIVSALKGLPDIGGIDVLTIIIPTVVVGASMLLKMKGLMLLK